MRFGGGLGDNVFGEDLGVVYRCMHSPGVTYHVGLYLYLYMYVCVYVYEHVW